MGNKVRRFRSVMCTVLLFSDLLVLVNEVTDKARKKPIFFLSAVIPLDICSVEELTEETAKEVPTPRNEEIDNIFLIYQKGQNGFPIILICDSQREKVKWMADILV